MAVAVVVGREGRKRSVVVAAGVMVVQRRRWIGMELMMGAEGHAVAHERGWIGMELMSGGDGSGWS